MKGVDKLSLIVKESRAHWDRMGKPYPEHLQAAIDQLRVSREAMPSTIEQWMKDILWTRWGWRGWIEDDCGRAYRDKAEKALIESAVAFTLRALGNNDSPETQTVVDSIVERRAQQAKDGA